jgi:hypothetical protein
MSVLVKPVIVFCFVAKSAQFKKQVQTHLI